MRLLEAFVTAFTRIFGITQPSEATRRRATLFIAAMLVLLLAVLLTLGAALMYHLCN